MPCQVPGVRDRVLAHGFQSHGNSLTYLLPTFHLGLVSSQTHQ